MNTQPNVSIHHEIGRVGQGQRMQALHHALELTRQAQAWAAYVKGRSRLRPATIHRKALDALVFSLEMRARSLAVPSKLVGTRNHQRALARLDELHLMCGHRLEVRPEGERLLVVFGGLQLGWVQDKHVSWLYPLIQSGATVHLLQVTGTDRSEGFYGCNVAFGRVGAALVCLRDSEGDVRGDGSSHLMEHVVGIYSWRGRQRGVYASVPHVVRHSSSGVDCGYGGGGPADLALLIP